MGKNDISDLIGRSKFLKMSIRLLREHGGRYKSAVEQQKLFNQKYAECISSLRLEKTEACMESLMETDAWLKFILEHKSETKALLSKATENGCGGAYELGEILDDVRDTDLMCIMEGGAWL